MFGERSLLMVKKVLMKNDLAMQSAISRQHRFSPDIHKLADSWSQCSLALVKLKLE